MRYNYSHLSVKCARSSRLSYGIAKGQTSIYLWRDRLLPSKKGCFGHLYSSWSGLSDGAWLGSIKSIIRAVALTVHPNSVIIATPLMAIGDGFDKQLDTAIYTAVYRSHGRITLIDRATRKIFERVFRAVTIDAIIFVAWKIQASARNDGAAARAISILTLWTSVDIRAK